MSSKWMEGMPICEDEDLGKLVYIVKDIKIKDVLM